MPLPVAFSNDTAPTGPDLDNDLAALGLLTTITCTIAGTNTLLLTPLANTPTVSAYQNYQKFSGIAAASNTGPVMAQVVALATLSVFKNTSTGPQLLTGTEIVGNDYVEFIYNSALASGAGGLLLTNPVTAASGGGSGSPGAYTNLHLWNSETVPNTQIALTLDSVTVSDQKSTFATIFGVSVTINTAVVGANGIDTGAIAASTCYHCYVIYNPNTQTAAGLISLNSNSPPPSPPQSSISGPPTLPSGYTLYMRAGAMFTDASANLKRTAQRNKRAQYIVTAGSNTTLLPLLASGAAGSASAPTWIALPITALVPQTADEVYLQIHTGYQGNTDSVVIVAPNNSYGAVNAVNPPPAAFDATLGTKSVYQLNLMLEGLAKNTIYWASSGAGGMIAVQGWIDSV